MEEVINGTSNYHDAKTGRDYNLNNLAPFKWIDDTTGRIVGTESNNKPPFPYSYRALPRVP